MVRQSSSGTLRRVVVGYCLAVESRWLLVRYGGSRHGLGSYGFVSFGEVGLRMVCSSKAVEARFRLAQAG